MEILIKELNLKPESGTETLRATASCVLANGDKWVLIKGFCVWEKDGRISVSNPPKMGFPNPFNQFISLSHPLKEKIHGLVLAEFEKAKLSKRPSFRQRIKTAFAPEKWKFEAEAKKNKVKDVFAIKLVLAEGKDRIQFKGLGIASGSRGLGFLEGGKITTARSRFVFSPGLLLTFKVGSLAVFAKQ